MRDYLTTMFNLIVGLVDANKIVILALVGLGVVLVCQLISLLVSGHRRFARKCHKLYDFLSKNQLTAENYDQFLALMSKMPQEFVRGYKVFEYSSYGLPSNFIKRFDSLDVESNGGILNHGKSLIKSLIYTWTIILALLSVALLGSDAALTGYALADAMLVPVLFFVFAKIMYFIFNAIKQQQYHIAVDEFNELLDAMDDKIVNKDNIPGPDFLSDIQNEAPAVVPVQPITEELVQQQRETIEVAEQEEPAALDVDDEVVNDYQEVPPVQVPDEVVEDYEDNQPTEEFYVQPELPINSEEDVVTEEELAAQLDEPETVEQINDSVDFEEDSITLEEPLMVEEEQEEVVEEPVAEVTETMQEEPEIVEAEEEIEIVSPAVETLENTEKEVQMEEKRGRGRPKKVAEGELVITNDKQFEEVLQKAEKLMRKSEEALSASQAKRVEKALKELIDAMAKYKEGQ